MVSFLSAVFIIISLHITVSFARPRLTIEPKYAHINVSDEVSVMCQATDNQSLIACQFIRDGHVTVLSLGHNSTSTPDKYFGTGLENGQCGIRMKGFQNNGKGHAVGCRVRGKVGGWVYEEMSVYVDVHQRIYFTSDLGDPAVVLPGDKCNILYRLVNTTVHPLGRCYFDPPGQLAFPAVHFSANTTPPSTSRYSYYGAGLESGECGLSLVNVTEEYNGRWSVLMEFNTPYHGVSFKSKTLVVAKPPRSIQLTTNAKEYEEGDTMTATCVASDSRPVANITWLLGDSVLRQDDDDDAAISDAWRWSHDLQDVVQTISRRVTRKDDGRVLKCRVGHVAVQGGWQERNVTLRVRPKEITDRRKLNLTGFVIGEHGVVDVDVWSSHDPRPTTIWKINDVTLEECTSDSTQHFTAAPSVNKSGMWNARLIIDRVTRADLQQTFLIIARVGNESGVADSTDPVKIEVRIIEGGVGVAGIVAATVGTTLLVVGMAVVILLYLIRSRKCCFKTGSIFKGSMSFALIQNRERAHLLD